MGDPHGVDKIGKRDLEEGLGLGCSVFDERFEELIGLFVVPDLFDHCHDGPIFERGKLLDVEQEIGA